MLKLHGAFTGISSYSEKSFGFFSFYNRFNFLQHLSHIVLSTSLRCVDIFYNMNMTKSQHFFTTYLPLSISNLFCENTSMFSSPLSTWLYEGKNQSGIRIQNGTLDSATLYCRQTSNASLASKTPLLTQTLNTISTKQCSEPIYCIVASTILHISCGIGYALALSCSPKHHQENGVTIKTWIKTGKKCLRKMEGK